MILCYSSTDCANTSYCIIFVRRGEMARLRLAAGLCVLKIVHVGAYAEMVSNETFQNVALIINVCIVLHYA